MGPSILGVVARVEISGGIQASLAGRYATALFELAHGGYQPARPGDGYPPMALPHTPEPSYSPGNYGTVGPFSVQPVSSTHVDMHEVVDESLSLSDKEKELITKALKKHKGRRRDAAHELGISERTLYRKIKEYDIEE